MKEKKKVSFACFFCGEVSASENLTELDGKKMCPECLSRETIVCYHSYEDSRSHYYIEDYFYKPEPIFYGKCNRFFGVELEVDEGGEIDDNVAAVMRVCNGNGLEHIYFKHDSSLEEGFEIITQPITLDYHLNEMPLKAIGLRIMLVKIKLVKLRELRKYNFKSFCFKE